MKRVLVLYCIFAVSLLSIAYLGIAKTNAYGDMVTNKVEKEDVISLNAGGESEYENITPTKKTSSKEEKKATTIKKTTTTSTTTKKTTTTKKKSDLEMVKSSKLSMGSYGRVYFPSLNHNVALYSANMFEGEHHDAQAIVDRKDSAAIYRSYGDVIIADHNYQGFKKLVGLKKGDKLYIKKKNGSVEVYQLTKKFEGKRTPTELLDKNNNNVRYMKKDLIVYTCYKKGILITLWKKV